MNYASLRHDWREANARLALHRRRLREKISDEERDELAGSIASLEAFLPVVHEQLVDAKAAKLRRIKPLDITDEQLDQDVRQLTAEIDALSERRRPLLVEKCRRELIRSADSKLAKLTPEERAALDSAGRTTA